MRMLDPRVHRKKLFYTMDCRAKPGLPRPSMSMLDAAKTWMAGTRPGHDAFALDETYGCSSVSQ